MPRGLHLDGRRAAVLSREATRVAEEVPGLQIRGTGSSRPADPTRTFREDLREHRRRVMPAEHRKLEPGLTVPQLRRRLQILESAVRTANGTLEAANERAALAEKAARDAWAFAKTL